MIGHTESDHRLLIAYRSMHVVIYHWNNVPNHKIDVQNIRIQSDEVQTFLLKNISGKPNIWKMMDFQ